MEYKDLNINDAKQLAAWNSIINGVHLLFCAAILELFFFVLSFAYREIVSTLFLSSLCYFVGLAVILEYYFVVKIPRTLIYIALISVFALPHLIVGRWYIPYSDVDDINQIITVICFIAKMASLLYILYNLWNRAIFPPKPLFFLGSLTILNLAVLFALALFHLQYRIIFPVIVIGLFVIIIAITSYSSYRVPMVLRRAINESEYSIENSLEKIYAKRTEKLAILLVLLSTLGFIAGWTLDWIFLAVLPCCFLLRNLENSNTDGLWLLQVSVIGQLAITICSVLNYYLFDLYPAHRAEVDIFFKSFDSLFFPFTLYLATTLFVKKHNAHYSIPAIILFIVILAMNQQTFKQNYYHDASYMPHTLGIIAWFLLLCAVKKELQILKFESVVPNALRALCSLVIYATMLLGLTVADGKESIFVLSILVIFIIGYFYRRLCNFEMHCYATVATVTLYILSFSVNDEFLFANVVLWLIVFSVDCLLLTFFFRKHLESR